MKRQLTSSQILQLQEQLKAAITATHTASVALASALPHIIALPPPLAAPCPACAARAKADAMKNPRLIRMGVVMELTGLSRSSIYRLINEGVFPPPVKISSQSSAWVEHEVIATNEARIAGKSADQLRDLVAQLISAR